MVTCGSVLLAPAGETSGCTAHMDSGRANVYEQTPAIVSNAAHAIRRFIGRFILAHTFVGLKAGAKGLLIVIQPDANEARFYSTP
jgi:hypothetical protein